MKMFHDRDKIELENAWYHEYLCHKCLYYSHETQVISDIEFDKFEKDYMKFKGYKTQESIPGNDVLNMVDWDRGIRGTTAFKIDRMSKTRVRIKAKLLVEKRLNRV